MEKEFWNGDNKPKVVIRVLFDKKIEKVTEVYRACACCGSHFIELDVDEYITVRPFTKMRRGDYYEEFCKQRMED
jgi:hypothetical protein